MPERWRQHAPLGGGWLGRWLRRGLPTLVLITCLVTPVLYAGSDDLDTALGWYQDVVAGHYRTDEPMRIVEYLADRWRLRGGGNAGYDESLDFVAEYLRSAGFEEVGQLRVLEGPLTLRPLAWEPMAASVALVEPYAEQLHSYADLSTIWGKYSGSTPAGGVTAQLIDVGAGGQPADYDGIDVRGKIVLGRGGLAALFDQAVEQRGAAGVVSDRPATSREYPDYQDLVRYEALPFGEVEAMRRRTGWGLKVPPRTGERLRRLLRAGPVVLKVEVEARFFDGNLRELVAEIPGAVAPEERIVLVAHLDNNKPGANNNASGVAGHAELAAAIAAAVADGTLAPPARTLTFLFGAEREGTRLWVERNEQGLEGVMAAINGDMIGEDLELTGSVYRIERTPDPAVYPSRPEAYTAPEDRHSGWEITDLGIDDYPGHFLPQLMWASASRRARDVGWEIMHHPFEGGSDHDMLLPLGVPTALSWHWVDRFLSTNFDTPDKVSVEEIENVALTHASVALLMASGRAGEAEALLPEVEAAALGRLRQEAAAAGSLLADLRRGAVEGVEEETAAQRLPVEQALLRDWARWHDEALASIGSLPVRGEAVTLDEAIEAARARLLARAEELVAALSRGRASEPREAADRAREQGRQGATSTQIGTHLMVDDPAGPVAIVGATLVDVSDSGRGRADVADAVIVFEGDRILAAGPRADVEIPAGARRIDATGKWIVPGLIDGFATLNHQGYADAYLAMGVTSIIGVSGGRRGPMYLHADPGPRVFVLDSVGSEALGSTEAVVAAVDEVAAAGARVVLLMYGLTPEQLSVAEARARRHGLAVIGELGQATYAEGNAVGLDAFVHTTRYSLDAAPREIATAVAEQPFSDDLDSPKWRYYLWLAGAGLDTSAIREHARGLGNGPAALMPTLSLLYLDMQEHANPWSWPVAGWISPEDVNAPADVATGEHAYDQPRAEAYAAVARRVIELERLYHAAGARHLAGSATDVWGTMPGISLHTELELLTRVGLSNREALAAATSNLAETFGFEGIGTIAPGGRADLVIVDSDPTIDLDGLKTPHLIVAAGRLVYR